jgi:NAD(P) transhydrogenase subunit alpha
MPISGASLVSRPDLFKTSDIVLQVRATPADPSVLRTGQTVIGFADPLEQSAGDSSDRSNGRQSLRWADAEITRAQSMDLCLPGHHRRLQGVLLTATTLPPVPPADAAAGTISPARVFIMGAGVVGLQAISTARRLGAKVEAYDVRPAVKEQVQSLGARFVELPLDAGDSEDKGGYAKAQDEAFYKRQREMMLKVVAASDVVVTTALIPGKRAPILLTTEMVEAMAPRIGRRRSRGRARRQLRLTRPDEIVVHKGRHDSGTIQSSALVPIRSQMYRRTSRRFLPTCSRRTAPPNPRWPSTRTTRLRARRC